MTTYPPAPLLWQNNLALDYSHSQIAYVGYEGTIFHLSGPFMPILGAQSGAVLESIAHLDASFKQLDNAGARQDGTTYYDTLYDPGLIDLTIKLGGMSPSDMRSVISSWLGAWDPKQLGQLCWFSPERGEWVANVRMNKPITDVFKQDWYTSQQVTFTWQARNDSAFWQGVDSVCVFNSNAHQILTVTGQPTGGTYTLTFGDVSVTLDFNAIAGDIESGLASLATIGQGNVGVNALDGSGSLFTIEFTGSLGAALQPLISVINDLDGGSNPLVSIVDSGGGGTASAGQITLTNIGDQPAWPRYLCYGPGTFTIGDGDNAANSITFGPLLDGQIALLNTLPRLPAVVDLTPTQTPQQLDVVQEILSALINFVTANNIPPLLTEFESLFGILPPQGPMYSLLQGRFTQPLAPMLTQVGPVTSNIPCSITGGNAATQIIAASTPMRRWPE